MNNWYIKLLLKYILRTIQIISLFENMVSVLNNIYLFREHDS